ncbi:SURF1 family protein [Limnohabitans sp. Hippo4]|uniref:SURF1 family protein n=1 Tax=Limnohabitans sp. Hippo4 TaxID=1826167 RepID=UPI001304B25F|nr:SURF1 family protein [Limnohabitans sp. Hippo4]
MFSKTWFVILLATLLVSGITAKLGFWQLGRAQTKETLNAITVARQLEPALLNDDWASGVVPEDWMQRSADLDGQWLPQFTVYLDNRSMKSQTGFFVLTPFQLSNGPVLLVQRGWVARDRARSDFLPPVPTPQGKVTLQGRVVPSPSKLMELGAPAPVKEGFNLLRQNIDLQEFGLETKLPMLATLQQTNDASDGLLREWPKSISGADKNRGYAFQWFALSALTLILFAWFQVWKKRKHV